jgi:hypothetical protein
VRLSTQQLSSDQRCEASDFCLSIVLTCSLRLAGHLEPSVGTFDAFAFLQNTQQFNFRMAEGFVDVCRMFGAQLTGFAIGILHVALKACPQQCSGPMPLLPSKLTRSFHATPITFLSHFFTQAESLLLHHRHTTRAMVTAISAMSQLPPTSKMGMH